MDLQTAKTAKTGAMPSDRPDVALIREAQELIRDEKSWIQDENARDATARSCMPDSGAAAYWCLFGALQAAWTRGAHDHQAFDDAVARLGGLTGYNTVENRVSDIMKFNDSNSHAAVMALCDLACA